ncbi:MAG: hypothetical protein K2G60_05320 [Oscillospiraceae bacterium]|nr:hypothetical protein [Oscillospiraceae bacterium]
MVIRCTPSHLHGKIQVNTEDISNTFLLCAGALSKEGVTLSGLKTDGMTEKVLNTLQYMGANVSKDNENITVSRNRLFGMSANVNGDEMMFAVYCALASVCEKGFTQITGLRTLKSETVNLAVKTLSKLRVACSFDDEDELIIWGGNEIIGGTADAEGNSYFALALTLLSCEARLPVDIHNAGSIESEFPDFIKNFNLLNGKFETIK